MGMKQETKPGDTVPLNRVCIKLKIQLRPLSCFRLSWAVPLNFSPFKLQTAEDSLKAVQQGSTSQLLSCFPGFFYSPLKFKGTAQGSPKQWNDGECLPTAQLFLWLSRGKESSFLKGLWVPLKPCFLIYPQPPWTALKTLYMFVKVYPLWTSVTNYEKG